MTDALPLSHSTNLARLGHAGETVRFAADADQLAAIARWAGVLSLEQLGVTVELRKLSATGFGLDFTVLTDITQACVVTLEPVPAHLARRFTRELNFVGPQRRRPDKVPAESGPDLLLDPDEEDAPEEIESLHYDLAAPVLEDLVLALDPYPRCPGVAFAPPDDGLERPESPFAVLKGLKSGS
jgi:uncharacterized metal-binding protein YceD (DUF177 family)